MAKKTAKKSAKKTAARGAKKTARAGAARKSARSGAAKKSARGSASRKGAAKKTGRKSARQPNAAFMKPLTPSPALAEVVGSKPLPRTEATSRLWDYIKKNDLQDSKNRRMIKADPALKAVFGGKSQVNMFEMTKLVSKHLR